MSDYTLWMYFRLKHFLSNIGIYTLFNSYFTQAEKNECSTIQEKVCGVLNVCVQNTKHKRLNETTLFLN